MIVYFKDKGEQTIQSHQFSNRSLKRRAKNNVTWNQYDIPVNPSYIEAIRTVGVVNHQSRWLNAVTIETTLSAEEVLNQFPFVDAIQVISHGNKGKDSKIRFSSISRS